MNTKLGRRMANKRATNYDEFEAKLLGKPEIRREYEALKPKNEMIRSLIKRSLDIEVSLKARRKARNYHDNVPA